MKVQMPVAVLIFFLSLLYLCGIAFVLCRN